MKRIQCNILSVSVLCCSSCLPQFAQGQRSSELIPSSAVRRERPQSQSHVGSWGLDTSKKDYVKAPYVVYSTSLGLKERIERHLILLYCLSVTSTSTSFLLTSLLWMLNLECCAMSISSFCGQMFRVGRLNGFAIPMTSETISEDTISQYHCRREVAPRVENWSGAVHCALPQPCLRICTGRDKASDECKPKLSQP